MSKLLAFWCFGAKSEVLGLKMTKKGDFGAKMAKNGGPFYVLASSFEVLGLK